MRLVRKEKAAVAEGVAGEAVIAADTVAAAVDEAVAADVVATGVAVRGGDRGGYGGRDR